MKNRKQLLVQFLLPAFLLGFILFGSTACNNQTEQKTVAKVKWDHTNEHTAHDFCEPSKNLGLLQSPIDIAGDTSNAAPSELVMNYDSTNAIIVNKGTTLQLEYGAKGSIQFNGKTYELTQIHTHTHSEHHLSGDSFAMEIHFVHQDLTAKWNNLAVIGVLVKERIGQGNPLLDTLSKLLPPASGDSTITNLVYSPLQLMPPTKSFFNYHGSLTAHDCTPSVTWFVMNTPIYATPQQIHAFRKLEGLNNRPLQNLGPRKVKYYTDSN